MENANSGKEIVIKTSRIKTLKSGLFLISGSLSFVLIGFYMIFSGYNIPVGIASIIFFGYALYISVRKYILRGISTIHITDEGIKTKFLPVRKELFIQWEAIGNISIQFVKTNLTKDTNLFISLKNPGQFLDLKAGESRNKLLSKLMWFATGLVLSKKQMEASRNLYQNFKKPDLYLSDDYETPMQEIFSLVKTRMQAPMLKTRS